MQALHVKTKETLNKHGFVVPAQRGKQASREATARKAGTQLNQEAGFPLDKTTSHSTKLAKYASQVAGYSRE